MKKKIIIGCIILAVILIAGSTILLHGKFFFTTEYYSTAEKAVKKMSIPSGWDVEIERTIDIIEITDNMSLYIGLTNDKNVYIAELFVKGGKFSCPNFGGLYYIDYAIDKSSEDISSEYSDIEDIMDKIPLYNNKGIRKNTLHLAVVFGSVQNHVIHEFAKVISYSEAELFEEMNVIYYVD